MIKKIGKFYKDYYLFAILCPIFMILEVFGDVLIPRLMGSTINDGVLTKNLDIVYSNGIKMIIVALLAFVFGASSTYFAAKAGHGLGKNLRHATFEKIQSFSFANLDDFEVSSLITRLTNDVLRISDMARMILRMAVRAPFMLILATFMAIQINAQLSIVFLAVVPVVAIVMFFGLRAAIPKFRKFQKKIDRINNRTQENLTSIRVVKAFVREDYEKEKFAKENENLVVTTLEAMNYIALMRPFMSLAMYAVISAVLWFGGLAMLDGNMQAGDLFSFLMYVGQILMSVMNLSMLFMNLSRARTSAERVIEVLEAESEFPESLISGITEVPDGSIEFENVTFNYPGNNHNSLQDINLKIKSGSTVAIIGSTGSSKTTLIQLIPRLYDVKKGDVKVGGISVKEYNVQALRDQVALVLQENTLFSGTIRSNMLWGNAQASDEDILEALEIAQAADFILDRPQGLDARVERGGSNFSGGQKQRLCIARSLLKNPKVMIFDDSTSAVDMTTEAKINLALEKYNPKLTKIIIAQRISSVDHSDKIIVLDEGRITGIGSHQELLENNQIYQEIYESQQKGMVAG